MSPGCTTVASVKVNVSLPLPLTALIATDLPEAGVGSAKYHALYAAGLVLLILTGAINMAVWKLKGQIVTGPEGTA